MGSGFYAYCGFVESEVLASCSFLALQTWACLSSSSLFFLGGLGGARAHTPSLFLCFLLSLRFPVSSSFVWFASAFVSVFSFSSLIPFLSVLKVGFDTSVFANVGCGSVFFSFVFLFVYLRSCLLSFFLFPSCSLFLSHPSFSLSCFSRILFSLSLFLFLFLSFSFFLFLSLSVSFCLFFLSSLSLLSLFFLFFSLFFLSSFSLLLLLSLSFSFLLLHSLSICFFLSFSVFFL